MIRHDFSDQHVAEWLQTYSEDNLQLAQHVGSAEVGRSEAALSRISINHRFQAMAWLARHDTKAAREELRRSVDARTEIFARHRRGEPVNMEYINAGDFQTLLDALASGDWTAAERFCAVFPAEFDQRSRSTRSSLYIARPLNTTALLPFRRVALP